MAHAVRHLPPGKPSHRMTCAHMCRAHVLSTLDGAHLRAPHEWRSSALNHPVPPLGIHYTVTRLLHETVSLSLSALALA